MQPANIHSGDEDPFHSDSGHEAGERNHQGECGDDCSPNGDNDDDDETSTNESQRVPHRALSAPQEAATFPADSVVTGSSARRVIAEPFFDDIIGGRGKQSNNHFGNQKYRKLVREKCEEYQSLTTNPKKAKFAEGIVARVKQNGARFLKQADGAEGFVEMDDSETRKKVGQVSYPQLQQVLKC